MATTLSSSGTPLFLFVLSSLYFKAGDDSPLSVKLRLSKPEMEARLDSAVDRVDSSRAITDQLAELGLADDDTEGCVRMHRAPTNPPTSTTRLSL